MKYDLRNIFASFVFDYGDAIIFELIVEDK